MKITEKVEKELLLVQERKGFIALSDVMIVCNCSRGRAFFILRALEQENKIIQMNKGVQIVFSLNTACEEATE